jgi:hypothetical protein
VHQPFPRCARAGTTPAGSPARGGRTPSSDWPRRRASHKGRGSPRPPGGTVHWRCGLPRPPGQGWVARRPSVPKGRLDNHRWAPCCCYTPVPPRWCSRPCPAPGPDAPANPCPDGPAFVARSVCAAEGAPGHGRWRRGPGPLADQPRGHAHRDAVRPISPGKRRLPAARRSHPAGTQDPGGGGHGSAVPARRSVPEDPPGAACTAGSCRGRYHTGPRPAAAPGLWPVSL